MKINKKLFNEIINIFEFSPYESGGFLGGCDDTVIKVIYDNEDFRFAEYKPNNKLLNDILKEWYENDIEFLGIFHTHYPKCTSLSRNDEKFINKFMQEVCDENDIMYFPIVIAKSEMCVYKAELIDGICEIKKDEILLV